MKQTIGFIGAGNMAKALIQGMLREGFLASQIWVSDADFTKTHSLKKELKVKVASNTELASRVNFLILATKPQDLKKALQEIAPKIKSQCVISIAAGVNLKTISKYLKTPSCLVRSMPNNPALVGAGITAFFSKRISANNQRKIEKIFKGCGKTLWVKKESDLDSVTALSGSGPAFVYYFIQGLSEAGEKLGLSPKIASLLALETVYGASLTLLKTKRSPAELIPLVASKGGTTLAGLEVLQKMHFKKILETTLQKASRRAKELQILFEKSENT